MVEISKLSRIDKELVVKFSEYLRKKKIYSEEFIKSALKKFIKGRIEHDENILTIDCDKEIMQEKMDIEAYKFIKSIQNDSTRDN